MPPSDWHPSASVDPDATIAEGVRIEAHAVIEGGVRIGAGSVVRSGSILMRGTTLGERVKVGPYAVIGGEPMDHRFRGEASAVIVGDGSEIREYSTVHRATGEGEKTIIGAGTLVMIGVHVAHNCAIGDRVTLVNLTQLGGHVQVGDDAVLGGGALVHQWVRIGRAAMVGGGSVFTQDVLPFCMARGNPARHYLLNSVGLKRLGFEGERLRALERAVRALRRGDQEALPPPAEQSPEVAELLAFRLGSDRGVARFVTRG